MPEPTQRDIHEARGEAAKPVVSHGVPQTHTATKRMPEPTQRDIHEARGEAAKPVVSHGVPQTHTATKRMPEPTQRDIHEARGEAAKPVVSNGVPQTHTATKRMPEPTSVVKINNKVLSKLKKLVDSTIHSLTASGKSSCKYFVPFHTSQPTLTSRPCPSYRPVQISDRQPQNSSRERIRSC